MGVIPVFGPTRGKSQKKINQQYPAYGLRFQREASEIQSKNANHSIMVQGGSNMTRTNCDLFTHK
jgi:hypothetical protein